MDNKFYIGQKVRGFYGVDTKWGQGKDEQFIVTEIKEMNNGKYSYRLKNNEKFTAVYGSYSGAPEHLLISETDWQKLPEWYRMQAFHIKTEVNKKMKEMGY